MLRGVLTPREEEVLSQLLAEKGITRYVIVDPVNEGKSLLGSTFPCEIETVSGDIVTTSAFYTFWLDWVDGHYTLGDEWREINIDGFRREQDKVHFLALQRSLQVEERNGRNDLSKKVIFLR